MGKIVGRGVLGVTLTGVVGWALQLPPYFSAKFTQIVKGEEGENLQYRGEVYYQRGEGLYWHYTSPVEKKIWIIQNRIVIYEPDIEQVTISTRRRGLNLERLLKGARELSRGHYTTEVEGREYNFTYSDRLEEIKYRDRIGNLVVIKFSGGGRTPPPHSLFTPTYPADVEIIYHQ
ncbi:MAG: LolA-like outer membrane lipoprotein chaperone [Campylobacterales bacterium]